MDKIKDLLKKHYLIIITIVCWILAFSLIDNKKTEDFAAFCSFAGTALIIVLIVKAKKAKKIKAAVVPTQSVTNGSASYLPPYIDDAATRRYLEYNYNNVMIVGRTYHDDVVLKLGEPVYLIQEPENEYDHKAVAVKVVRNGQYVLAGYVAKDSNFKSMINDFYGRGEGVAAFVDDATSDTMTVGFYK